MAGISGSFPTVRPNTPVSQLSSCRAGQKETPLKATGSRTTKFDQILTVRVAHSPLKQTTQSLMITSDDFRRVGEKSAIIPTRPPC